MSATHSFVTSTALRASARQRAAGGLRRLSHAAALAWRAMTSRRDLREMDDRMLSDLGISRAQANFEASRPLWSIAPKRR